MAVIRAGEYLETVLGDDERWRAIQNRDEAGDGLFVYGVRSTRIFCRPSCPARRPRREQVAFYDTPEAAAAAGFRACRRCHPDEPRSSQADLAARAKRWIEEHSHEEASLAALGRALDTSPYHLHRIFKRATGLTPRQFREVCRMAEFKSRLKEGEAVTSAMYGAGFGSSRRLYEQAYSELGMTPLAYRRGGRGQLVDYDIIDSPLGRLLVAATERGLCAVALAEDDAVLEAFLRSELPRAELRRGSRSVDTWMGPILDYLAARKPSLDLPVDADGTAFQRQVWRALQQIPYGATRTYAEVARDLGQPSAVRAVARACATNPVAIVVPCHRVIRQDGALAGYRWGLERKRSLLDMEREGA